MSVLKNLLNKFQQLFSGSAAPPPDSSRAKAARQQLFDAVLETTEDGIITAEEMSDIRAIQAKLGMSDNQLNEIKIQVLRNLIDKVMDDNIVTEDEMDFIEQIEIDLQLGVSDSLKIKADIEKVRKMYRQSKANDFEEIEEDDFFEDEYDDDYDDTEYGDEYDDDDDSEALDLATVAATTGGVVLADALSDEYDEADTMEIENDILTDES